TLNLSFPASTPDIVDSLYLNGIAQATGTWGAFGSGAMHESIFFAGAGMLDVTNAALPVAGDFNQNGVVDAGDYIAWRKNSGTSNALANDNGLGTPIGPAHYNLWRSSFGNSSGAGSGIGLGSVAVPESESIILLMIGLSAATGCSRR